MDTKFKYLIHNDIHINVNGGTADNFVSEYQIINICSIVFNNHSQLLCPLLGGLTASCDFSSLLLDRLLSGMGLLLARFVKYVQLSYLGN